MGPKGEGNQYYQDLKKFFEPYKNHDAIKIAENLTKQGFSFDAPPNFILSLGELPNLEVRNGYSDYLINRSGGEDVLEKFRLALIDLAIKSNFTDFFEQNRPNLESYLNNTVKNLDTTKVINWMRDFYGWSGDDFYTVFAPAMFPGGGYGATITLADDRNEIYQIIRENGTSNSIPVFMKGMSLELLTLHEWGHAFVNPSVEENMDLVHRLNLIKLFEPVEEIMMMNSYGSVETFFNEQILRGVTSLAAKDLYGDPSFWAEKREHIGRGFYLTDFTIKQLEYYEENRDKYKTFKDFVPYLLEQYHNNANILLEEFNNK